MKFFLLNYWIKNNTKMKHQNEVYLLYFKAKGSSSQLFIVNTQFVSV
jgi:hypothetical protein